MPTEQQPRTEGGRFGSPYQERRGSALAMRLPASLDCLVREEAERRGVKPNQIIVEIVAHHFGWQSQGNQLNCKSNGGLRLI
jgi:hypothetical protein